MKTIKYICTAAILLGVFSSCSLKEVQESSVSPDNFFKTKSQCIAGLNSCYYPLKSCYDNAYFFITEATTDLYRQSSTSNANATLTISPSSSGKGPSLWKYCYQGVKNAICCRDGIEKSDLSEKVKAPLLAEANIMMALYYYHLTCIFNGVPYYTEFIDSPEALKRIAVLPRTDADEIRDNLIELLQEWTPKCSQVRSCDVENNRAGAALGWMLIAKMSMWNHRWDDAVDAIGHLEAMYGDLSSYSLDDLLWRRKNTPERIYEIQHKREIGGISYVGNIGSYVMPYPRTTGTCIYNGVEIPELGNESTCYTPVRANSYFYSTIMGPENVDKRWQLNLCLHYNGHSWPGTQTRFPGFKFWCPNLYGTQDDNNYPVFRYADALLMKAECLCEKDDPDYNESIRYLNMTKERAGIALYGPFDTVEGLREEIRNERARELAGEFQRKFDLVRWGIWYEQTKKYNIFSALLGNIKPCHEYYPIPDDEVRASGGALDNEEYNKYM